MDTRKLLSIGNASTGLVLPPSLLRSMGWLKGDFVTVFKMGGDIVVRNDSKRAARFIKEFRGRRETLAGVDAR